MEARDSELIDRLRALAEFLAAGGIVRLGRATDEDQLVEGLRDLGRVLAELGADLLARVDELDAR